TPQRAGDFRAAPLAGLDPGPKVSKPGLSDPLKDLMPKAQTIPAPPNPKPAFEPAKSPKARFVRIECGSQNLRLAEVQVFSGGKNIALEGKASQISTGYDAGAGRAIDGNTEGNFVLNSVTHTTGKDHSAPWWEVDLGGIFPIDRVVIWNRTDSHLQPRLSIYAVILMDDGRTPVKVLRSEKYPDPCTEHVFGAGVAQRPGDAPKR